MSKRNNIFFTADWHLGHAKSIEYDNRPFRDMDHMIASMVKRFNATVPEGATTYFLGDMGFGNIIKDTVDQLNGTKILVLGNHDKGARAMSRLGFDLVLYMASINVASEVVTMTHCPLRGIHREDVTGMAGNQTGNHWHNEQKNQKFSIPDWGQFHLHGHIHSPNHGKSVKILGRQMDVGVPANKYTPISISQIESWIAKTKREENEA